MNLQDYLNDLVEYQMLKYLTLFPLSRSFINYQIYQVPFNDV